MKRSRGKKWIAELIVMLMIFTTGLGSIHVKAAGNEEPAKTQTLTQNGIRMQFTETAPGSDLLDVTAESVDGTKVIDSIEANGEMHAGTSFTFLASRKEKTEFSVHYHETGTAASGNELTVASANNGDEEEAGGALPDAVIGLPGLRALAAPAAEAEDGVETFTFIPEFAALETHKVTLDVNGGENYPSTTFDWPNGMTLPEPAPLVRTGYTFAGWHEIDETTIRLWNFAIDTVTRDITLVAGWDKMPDDELVTVEAKKVLLDQNSNDISSQLKDGEFTFRLTADRSTNGNITDANREFTATNAADGSVQFYIPKAALENTGLIAYELTEVDGEEPGVTYNPGRIHYYVTIGDELVDYKVKYFGDMADTGPTNPADPSFIPLFINTMNTEQAADSNVTVNAKKVLLDQNNNDISSQLKDGEFTFRLTADRSTNGNITDANREFTATNAADGNISFSIPKTALENTGIIVYEMTEEKGSEAGVTYNPDGIHYYVTIGDALSGYKVKYYSTLTAEGPADQVPDGLVLFLNWKNTEAADQNITVSAKKVLLDQNDNDLMSQLKDGEFTFRLTAVRSLFVDGLNETNSEFTATNAADGSISFAIPKTAIIDDDIIIYEMTEVTGSEAGITYNPTGLHYYVAVGGKTDNYEVQYFETLAEDGPTDPLPADMVLFLNRKNTESADQNITVSAKKVLQDQNGGDISSQLQNGEFTFRLTADRSLLNALTEANHTFTATNAADGSISFAIPKTAIEDTDIIIYEMTEDAGSEAGVTYNPDGTHYYVVVGGKASSYTVQYYATLTAEGIDDFVDAAKVVFTNRKNVTPVNPARPGSSGSSGDSYGSGRRVAGNTGAAGPGVSTEAAAESSPEDTGEPNDNSGNAAELNQSVPKTADPLPVLPLLTLMLGSGAGMYLLDRRKTRTK